MSNKDLVKYDSGNLGNSPGEFKPTKKQKLWLTAIAQSGKIRNAEKLTGIDHAFHYFWLKKSPGYKAAFDEAMEQAVDMAIDEVYRRGVEGIEKPLVYKGQLTGQTIREYSDNLLMFYVKAHRPEFRDSFPLNQFSTGPVQFNVNIEGEKGLRIDGKKIEPPRPPEEQE